MHFETIYTLLFYLVSQLVSVFYAKRVYKNEKKSQRYCFEIERTERFELTHFFLKLSNSI